jgi:hypothetical protein
VYVVLCCRVLSFVCVCVFMCSEDLGGLKALRPSARGLFASRSGVGLVLCGEVVVCCVCVCVCVCGDDSASASVFVFVCCVCVGVDRGGRSYDISVCVCVLGSSWGRGA